jgi:hypothetical protein
MKIDVLKCFETEQGICGEYYAYDKNGSKYLVLKNCNDIKVFSHYLGKKIEDCLGEATTEVKQAILIASTEYLKAKGVRI